MNCISHSLFIQGAIRQICLGSRIGDPPTLDDQLTTVWNLEFNKFSQCERISMMTKEKPVSMSLILLIHYNIQTALWLQKDF